MFRRFAGWLMALQEPREPKQSIACAVGIHTPRLIRRGGHYVYADCVKPGCPVARTFLSNQPHKEA